MKILLINKFLYPRGGDCVYTLNVGEALKAEGHEVYYWGMKYPKNLSFNEEKYFASEVNFTSNKIKGRIKAIMRIFGKDEIRYKFTHFLDKIQPDVVHLNNIHSYLSPIIAKIAHDKGIRVVWTLHDYKLICPSYTMLYKEKLCRDCQNNSLNVITRCCMKNNLIASLIAWKEYKYWNIKRINPWIDSFICPSRFMLNQIHKGGIPKNKLSLLPNFIDKRKREFILNNSTDEKEKNSYAYIGRISDEKGVNELLNIASKLPYKLYLAGEGPSLEKLKQEYNTSNIIFLGNLSALDVIKLMKRVCFTILPSKCFENYPLSAIESFCCGTPVLAHRVGGMPELIEAMGYKTFYENNDELDSAIKIFFENIGTINQKELSEKALNYFSPEEYVKKLISIYTSPYNRL